MRKTRKIGKNIVENKKICGSICVYLFLSTMSMNWSDEYDIFPETITLELWSVDNEPIFWEKEILWFLSLMNESQVVTVSINAQNNFEIVWGDEIQQTLDKVREKVNYPLDNRFHFLIWEEWILGFITEFFKNRENLLKKLYIKPISHESSLKNREKKNKTHTDNAYWYEVLIIEPIHAWHLALALSTTENINSCLPLTPKEVGEFQWDYVWDH